MFGRRRPQRSAPEPSFDEMLTQYHNPSQWSFIPRGAEADTLLAACRLNGMVRDTRFLGGITALYAYVVHTCPVSVRQTALEQVVDAVRRGETSSGAVVPMLHCDTDMGIVATAAMDFAQLCTPTKDADGPGLVLFTAKNTDDPERRVALIQGLYLLGDARVLPLLDHAWETVLDARGRAMMLQIESGLVATAMVDFVLDKLETTDDGTNGTLFAAVIAALSKLATNTSDGLVYEVERSFPITNPDEPPITYLNHWSVAEYGQVIAPRLRAIWRREQEPKITQVAASAWGVGL